MVRDVVYVYKRSVSDEFRYSVKSLKNITHGRIWVIGDYEKWFDEEGIWHIRPEPHNWIVYSPYHDVISKLLTAVRLNDLSDEFILMNDDFFIMSRQKIMPYIRGDLIEHAERRKVRDQYKRALDNTVLYLKNHHKTTRDYELHIPMVFNKHKLNVLIDSYLPQIYQRSGILIRSLYGNVYGDEAPLMDDPKNPTDFRSKAFLSTNETTFKTDEIGRYIREVLS